MKRRLIMVALFLILGTVLNVAVAWGCAWWSKGSSGIARVAYEPFQMNGSWWLTSKQSYFGTQVYASQPFRTREFLDEFVSFYQLRGYYQGGNPPSWVRLPRMDVYGEGALMGPLRGDVGRGWPAVALSYGLYSRIEGDRVLPVSRVSGGFKMGEYRPWAVGFPRVVPLRPIGLGFAINTIFYAAILWLLIPGSFALRRHIRRKRGLCAACGYDMSHADHDACPECGTSIPCP